MARHLRGIDPCQTDRLARAHERITIDDPWAGASDCITIPEAESVVKILRYYRAHNHSYHDNGRNARAANDPRCPTWEQELKHLTLRE